MVNRNPAVVVIANDTVPGCAMPVAAPGLRAFGIAEGLRFHDFATEIVVDRASQSKIWHDEVPAPSQPGTVTLAPTRFMEYLEARAPVTAIVTNSNQVDYLRRSADIKFIVDFFAPKMLELAYKHGGRHPEEALAQLRARKMRAIDLGDAFIVNGRKKVPYFLAWLLQSGKDVRGIPLEVVHMAIPNHFRPLGEHDKIRFGMAGYLQGWSKPAAWLDIVLQYVERGEATLDVLIPEHWGQAGVDLESDRLSGLTGRDGVTQHGAMTFSEYQTFVSEMDVILDVFSHTREREYAMVTRTVAALACGRPVVHPGFTEVTPFIRQHDAGWIIDPGDEKQIEGVFDSIIADRSIVERKAANARTVWNRQFSPPAAATPLARTIRSLWE